MEKNHIVFVIGNYKNGGVAMHSSNLANAFAEKGYEVTILVTGGFSAEAYFQHHPKVEIVGLKDYAQKHGNDSDVLIFRKKQQGRLRLFKRLRYITRFFKKLDSILAEWIRDIRKSEDFSVYAVKNPDAVYIPFGIGYFEKIYLTVKALGGKIIYAERNAPELEYPEDFDLRKRLIKKVSHADGAVLQTENELEFYGGALKNPVVINNPVKTDLPIRFEGERRKVIVNFCRVSKQKNLPLLFESAVKLHKEHPEYIFEIYGNTVEKYEEELLKEYKELISGLGATEYIKLLPPSKDVHRLINDCAMFVSSSDFEGLSNSMIEAMAMGLPCVCTDCLGGGAREMIADGENGLLVPMNDAETLYKAMKRFIEDRQLAEKCSRNAYKKRDELSIDAIADKWLDFIKTM